jgi:hypothetical protein
MNLPRKKKDEQGKGLSQGDCIASLLFNCVVDVFSKMLVKEADCGLIRRLCLNFIPRGVVRLLFLEKDPEVALNLK